jgi:hypothetical protein
MKAAVETIFVGNDREYNRRLLQMCGQNLAGLDGLAWLRR